MATSNEKAVVLGATGPTGIHLCRALLEEGWQVTAVSRSVANLERCFGNIAVQRVAADLRTLDDARRVIEGHDVAFDCIGLPGSMMSLHPVTARHIADAVGQGGVRCVQVSSFWSYLPLQRLPLDENHPREGGVDWVRFRREAEDILQEAGGAILHLPDFFGPYVHTSTLQQPLANAARGSAMNWIGAKNVARDYVYVPDAMQVAARIARESAAFGERWILPGCGTITAMEIAEIAGRHLGRRIKVRAAGLRRLKLFSLFSSQLHQFMPMAPYYVEAISYNSSKLESLIGPVQTTSYEQAIGETLNWINRQSGLVGTN